MENQISLLWLGQLVATDLRVPVGRVAFQAAEQVVPLAMLEVVAAVDLPVCSLWIAMRVEHLRALPWH